MKGIIQEDSIRVNLGIAIADLFAFIKLITEAREDKLNKQGNKFNTIEKQKEELVYRVSVIAFCLASLNDKAETSKRVRELVKILVFEKLGIFENNSLKYSNTLKHISAKSVSFYQNINTAIHEARQDIINTLFILSIGDDSLIQTSVDEEILNFSNAFKIYLKSGLVTSSLEYYEVHRTIFDKAYKMIHYAMILSEIENSIELPSDKIVPNDLRLVCSRLQNLCKNQDFIVARNFVTKLFDLKLDNMEVILTENLLQRAELKLDMLEYILLPRDFQVRLYFNPDINKKDIYYLIRRLHEETWVQKQLLEGLKKGIFLVRNGEKRIKITYSAITKLLNNHDIKINDRIDAIFS